MSDERAPSVPSEPFDELFSLAYRFRCPGDAPRIDVPLVLARGRCESSRTSNAFPRRALTIHCTTDKRSDSPILTKKACGLRAHTGSHYVRLVSHPPCPITKTFVYSAPANKMCGVAKRVMPYDFHRVHLTPDCRILPNNNNTQPLKRSRCGNKQVSIAAKLVKGRPWGSLLGCRVFHSNLNQFAYHKRCESKKFTFAPLSVHVMPSFICYQSEKILLSGGIKVGNRAFICPKNFPSTFIHPIMESASSLCNVYPAQESFPAFKSCIVVKPVRTRDGKVPLRPQIRQYGASCRTYPLGTQPGDILQGNRTCASNPRVKVPNNKFPFVVDPGTRILCKLFPLGIELPSARSRCGTIIFGTAPVLKFGRVWGGVSPFFVPPTNGRVGGAVNRVYPPKPVRPPEPETTEDPGEPTVTPTTAGTNNK